MISIFTPTYNRKHLLPRLYNSLCRQSSKDFEWLIVDDGSTDGTKEYVEKIKAEKKIVISYYFQENSGKHVAHNKAVEMASGELFFCVDSDDILAYDNTIQGILAYWDTVKQEREYAGIVSYKGFFNETILGDYFPEDLDYCSTFNLARKYHSNGERNIIYSLTCLRKVSYPIFKNEKFCPDSYISDFLSKEYTMKLRRNVDVLCEYQEDGLSRNFARLMKRNPKGFCIANMQIIDMHDNWKDKCSAAIRFWAFKFLADDKTILYNSNKNRWLVNICSIPGWCMSIYYKVRL